jgi:hypothetical protein
MVGDGLEPMARCFFFAGDIHPVLFSFAIGGPSSLRLVTHPLVCGHVTPINKWRLLESSRVGDQRSRTALKDKQLEKAPHTHISQCRYNGGVGGLIRVVKQESKSVVQLPCILG